MAGARSEPRCDALFRAVEDGLEAVGGGLRTDVHPGKVLVEEVSNEGGLAGGIRADQQHQRLRVEVRVREQWVEEFAHHVLLLDRAHLVAVELLDAMDDRVEGARGKLWSPPAAHVCCEAPAVSTGSRRRRRRESGGALVRV